MENLNFEFVSFENEEYSYEESFFVMANGVNVGEINKEYPLNQDDYDPVEWESLDRSDESTPWSYSCDLHGISVTGDGFSSKEEAAEALLKCFKEKVKELNNKINGGVQ